MANTYVGKVLRNDLEGGAWTLLCDTGVIYQLMGGDSGLLVDGLRAEVTGKPRRDQMGIAMVGEILEVKSYRVLS